MPDPSHHARDEPTATAAATVRGPRVLIERIEVWADGERLSSFVKRSEAFRFAEALGPDWRSIEVVLIKREVHRVR